jgi:hypothetical protein
MTRGDSDDCHIVKCLLSGNVPNWQLMCGYIDLMGEEKSIRSNCHTIDRRVEVQIIEICGN